MEEQELERFREAGRIGAKIREDSKRLIMVGETLLNIVETIEQMMDEEGVKPAFPVNISINDVAAHYTPELGSEKELNDDDLVKVDLGVEVEGALSDTAYSIDLSNNNTELVKAAEEALEKAIGAVKPGIGVGEVGGVIEDTIKGYGFKPIANLSGHMIKSNDLHAGVDVPNIRTKDEYKFQEGDIFAIEPFSTNGNGYVEDLDQVEIFSIYMPSKVRMRQSRKIIDYVIKNYGMKPFSERWIRKEFKSRLLVSAALKELLRNHFIQGYPVLREVSRGLVAQAEHTILVTSDGCEVLTK